MMLGRPGSFLLVGAAVGLSAVAIPTGALPINACDSQSFVDVCHITAFVSVSIERIETCFGGNNLCFQVWFRPNVEHARSIIPGNWAATAKLTDGNGAMNDCFFTSAGPFPAAGFADSCRNFDLNARHGGSHLDELVLPGTTLCHGWQATLTGPGGGLVGQIRDIVSGQQCVTTPNG